MIDRIGSKIGINRTSLGRSNQVGRIEKMLDIRNRFHMDISLRPDITREFGHIRIKGISNGDISNLLPTFKHSIEAIFKEAGVDNAEVEAEKMILSANKAKLSHHQVFNLLIDSAKAVRVDGLSVEDEMGARTLNFGGDVLNTIPSFLEFGFSPDEITNLFQKISEKARHNTNYTIQIVPEILESIHGIVPKDVVIDTFKKSLQVIDGTFFDIYYEKFAERLKMTPESEKYKLFTETFVEESPEYYNY